MNKVVELLKNNFPELVRDQEGTYEVDIEKLKLELGKGSNIINEGYSLNWLGQSYSRVLRDCPTTTLIKPENNHNQLPENINSDNVYIEGDNLEVLKHLKNAYSSKIKMIYIDPPYNTGSDGFVYNDSFNFDVEIFMRLSGLDKEEAEKVLNYTKSKRNSHSAWLTFMYPRLYIARELLKDDGVIFISIDDNEHSQLKLLCDQIFGEENFISDMIWFSNAGGRSDAKYIATTKEYILMYAKNIACTAPLKNKRIYDKDVIVSYSEKDEISKYKKGSTLQKTGNQSELNDRTAMGYSIYYNPEDNGVEVIDETFFDANNNCCIGKANEKLLEIGYFRITPAKKANGAEGRWRWGKDRFLRDYKKEIIFEKKTDGTYMCYTKDRIYNDYKEEKNKDYIHGEEMHTASGTRELSEIFNKKIFDYPKPTKLIKYLINLADNEDITVLDFFSGSSTTADAVMQLNAEDNGNRKFVMVQLPEQIDEKNSKEAYEFCTKELKQEPIIPTIAKERIKRAAKKIKEDNKDKEYIDNLDLGFKVYKTIKDDRTDVSQLVLFDVKDGIKTEVDDLDALLTTWMLHDGYDLNTNVEEIMINKYKGYRVEQTLYLLDKGFSTEDLLSLVEKLNDPKTPLINQIILNSSNFANIVLQEFHENVFSKNSKEAKIVVEDR